MDCNTAEYKQERDYVVSDDEHDDQGWRKLIHVLRVRPALVYFFVRADS